ncbi:Hsp20/alpha crystallin family protein [Segetibacter aerophilus]|uniref:Heat-shock protein Hsp20 n=1 Tax=Segetibacter aerophilus TaxID=670293 RepID=A0A512B940_9BACT|nr:Hsp20/alpha crystallin family protein [Segetibacter aerophilus]GEO08470.1 heat-shock protein Hsp20 [Segetibacter aerophilus]
MILTKSYPAAKNLNNVFEELFNAFPTTWGNDITNNTTAPVNINETSEGYDLQFNVPGRNKEDFKINVENGLLTVSYEKKEQTEAKEVRSVRREWSYQSFKRSFTLSDKVNADGIEAKYENGILKVYLPKKEEVKNSPKQISIQ